MVEDGNNDPKDGTTSQRHTESTAIYGTISSENYLSNSFTTGKCGKCPVKAGCSRMKNRKEWGAHRWTGRDITVVKQNKLLVALFKCLWIMRNQEAKHTQNKWFELEA